MQVARDAEIVLDGELHCARWETKAAQEETEAVLRSAEKTWRQLVCLMRSCV